MKLDFAQLVDALSAFEFDVLDETTDERPPINRIELYAGQPPEEGVLYIAENTMSPISATALEATTGPECTTSPESTTSPISTTIYVGAHRDGEDGLCPLMRIANASAAATLNAIERYRFEVEALIDKMRECYYAQHDLQGLCQALADFVGNPVLAYDDTLLPVAQTEFPLDYAMNLFGSQKLEGDYIFKTIPDWVRKSGVDPFEYDRAYLTSNPDKSVSTYVCNILSNGEFQGFMEIFQVNKPITKGEASLLEEACKIVSAAFPYSDNRFIVSRLEGRESSKALTESWLSSLRWRPDDGIYVLAIELPRAYVDSKTNMDHVMRMMRSFFQQSVSVQMGESPVIVANDRLSPRGRTIEKVSPFIVAAGIGTTIGVSEVMVGVGTLHEGYAHAQFAAQYGQNTNTGPVVCFEECRFAFFADLCNMEKNTKLVVDAVVAHMFADDVATGSENTLTAKTYIETGFNLNATAKALSVHRNTIAYRLKHMSDRYGLDLSSPIADRSLVFQVLLSGKLLLGDA